MVKHSHTHMRTHTSLSAGATRDSLSSTEGTTAEFAGTSSATNAPRMRTITPARKDARAASAAPSFLT